MNHHEVKRILRSCRPGGRDCDDPVIQAALQELTRDASLAKWYAEEQSVDRCIHEKLRAATPLDCELRSELAAARCEKRSHHKRRRAWISMTVGACFTALVLGTFLWVEAPRLYAFDLAEFREAMIRDAKLADRHGALESGNFRQMMPRLSEFGSDSPIDLPAGLHNCTGAGFCVLNWRGRKVHLIRFLLDGTRQLDLFVVDPAGCWGGLLPTEPQFDGSDKLRTACWRKGSKVFLVKGSGTEADMRRIVWSRRSRTESVGKEGNQEIEE